MFGDVEQSQSGVGPHFTLKLNGGLPVKFRSEKRGKGSWSRPFRFADDHRSGHLARTAQGWCEQANHARCEKYSAGGIHMCD